MIDKYYLNRSATITPTEAPRLLRPKRHDYSDRSATTTPTEAPRLLRPKRHDYSD